MSTALNGIRRFLQVRAPFADDADCASHGLFLDDDKARALQLR